MSLQIEQLTGDVAAMARIAAEQQRTRRDRAETTRALLAAKATAWAEIDALTSAVDARDDLKYYRPARPIDAELPLDAAIPAPPPPERATIIATDGSQILPDRHAAFLYYLVNIGAFIYYHGVDDEPTTVGRPTLHYAHEDGLDADDGAIDASTANVRRDLNEITLLADLVHGELALARPVLGLLDQRLLYWPFGQRQDADRVAYEWGRQMSAIKHEGALLAGYIDRPGKRSVVGLLQGLADPNGIQKLEQPWRSGDLTDLHLFSRILDPGERSRVFAEISPVNRRFREQDVDNEVAFFYYNPSPSQPDDTELLGPALARVDIPLWVAQDEAAVATVHGLIESQCRIIADYPYALARADELAVVGYSDATELDMMIDLAMQNEGVSNFMSSKLLSKTLARYGRTRLTGF